jgi:hypothetical protein
MAGIAANVRIAHSVVEAVCLIIIFFIKDSMDSP